MYKLFEIMKKTLQRKKKSSVKSIREFKELYLPFEVAKEKYFLSDPLKRGVEIGEMIYDKNKHILFDNNKS